MRNYDFNNFDTLIVDNVKLPLISETDYQKYRESPSDFLSDPSSLKYVNPIVNEHTPIPSLVKHDNQSDYAGMPKEKGNYVILHEYTDSSVGHVNLEFVKDGVRYAWLGANQAGLDKTEPGLKGGIQDEVDDSSERVRTTPNSHNMTVFNVNDHEFNQMFNRATELRETIKDYDINQNCLHFADDVLSHGLQRYGSENETLKDYVKGNTLA